MTKIFLATIVTTMGITSPAYADKACFAIEGMTCATCGVTVKSAINKLQGIQTVKVSVERKNAMVEFEKGKANSETIKKSIDDVGYKATPLDCKKIEG
jgi:copper chaperone CopZ